jgi:hypothetical protein
MSKGNELKTTTEIVKDILTVNRATRNNDSYLIVKVYEQINPQITNMPFSLVMNNLKDFGLPSTETIRRCRQKIQATYPELSGDADVEAYRTLNEGVFKEYVRGVV